MVRRTHKEHVTGTVLENLVNNLFQMVVVTELEDREIVVVRGRKEDRLVPALIPEIAHIDQTLPLVVEMEEMVATVVLVKVPTIIRDLVIVAMREIQTTAVPMETVQQEIVETVVQQEAPGVLMVAMQEMRVVEQKEEQFSGVVVIHSS